MTTNSDPKGEKPAAEKSAPKAAPKPAAQKPTQKPAQKPTPKPAAHGIKRGIGGGGGFLWAFLALALVAGAGAATMNVWMPKLAGAITAYQAPLVDQRLAPVAERVQALEKEQRAQSLKAAEEATIAAGRPPPPSADDIKEIVRRLTKMETRLAALRKMVGATRPPEAARTAVESLQRLSGRLQNLERNRKEVDAILKRIATTDRSLPGDEKRKSETEVVTGGRELVVATRKLNRRIKSDKPFADVLAQVERLAGADGDIAVNIAALEPLAASGVKTMDQLRRQFTATADAVLRAEALPPGSLPAETGWWDKTINKLAEIVSLRRQGEQGEQGEQGKKGAAGLVTAAKSALGENNLAAAIKALEGLSGPRLAAAAAWLGQARGRETAENAASALNLFALTRLAGFAAAKLPEKAAPEKNSPKITRE